MTNAVSDPGSGATSQHSEGAWQSLAIFSDVHCNRTALQACVADLKTLRQTEGHAYPIAFLGDLLDTGPCPNETLDLAEAISSIHIRGNHEVYLTDCMRGLHRNRYATRQWRYVPWTLDQLGTQKLESYDRKLLDQWQSAEGMVRLVHASLERNDRVPDFFGYHTAGLLEDSHFRGQVTRVTFAGHSHLGAVYERPGNELWVNAGSVGYPFIGKPDDQRHVPYATYTTCLYQPVTGSVQVTLRRVAYPLGDLIADYLRAGVLDSCAPFSMAVFAQTVLNRSVIFQAMRKARLLGVKPDQDDVYLQGYLVSEGLEAEMQGVLQKHLDSSRQ